MSSLYPAVIVDIDGTVARKNGRGIHDYHMVGTDVVVEPIANLVRLFCLWGFEIVYVSGRPDSCRDITIEWLLENFLPVDRANLFQRKTGDYRPDDVVKRELYDAHIRDQWDVKYVLDDRNRVVKMWRELGLTVLQVAEGDF